MDLIHLQTLLPVNSQAGKILMTQTQVFEPTQLENTVLILYASVLLRPKLLIVNCTILKWYCLKEILVSKVYEMQVTHSNTKQI